MQISHTFRSLLIIFAVGAIALGSLVAISQTALNESPWHVLATVPTPIPDGAPAFRGSEIEDRLPRADIYGQIPLSFEQNDGQADAEVKYLARASGYNLYLTPSEAVLSLGDGSAKAGSTVRTLRMKLEGSEKTPRMAALGKMAATSNYFVGNDPGKWRRNIPNYSRVEYKQVYEGVDLVYYGNQQQLEYDFKVSAGTDPGQIRMSFSGAEKVEIGEQGDLVLKVDGREVRMLAPVTYQEKDGIRGPVASRYVLHERPATDSPSVGFEVAAYDTTNGLVIDPVLVYSTYLGGSGDDQAASITVDAAGDAYLIGFTDSLNFPTAAAMRPTYAGGAKDVFVSKLNAAGTALVYSTYLGGTGQDAGSDIAVDADGNAYITGYTESNNFPVANPFQASRNGLYSAFVAKLNPAGSQLVYSTYFGGFFGEAGTTIAVDPSGNAYVGGASASPNLPRRNPLQSSHGGGLADGFIAKFDPSGGQLVYSTYLGGNADDAVTGIVLDAARNAYVTGVTLSTNFPTANPIQSTFGGGAYDAFVSKINPAGTSLVYSTYYGGTEEDRGHRIALDASDNVYVGGLTYSPNFPTSAALQPAIGGGSDGFVTKLNTAGAVSYSTFLGGSGDDLIAGLAVSPAGNAHPTGFTASTNFPLVDASQAVYGGGEMDGFAAKFNIAGNALDYSTFIGGAGSDSGVDIAVDAAGSAYVFGRTASSNFPTANPLQPANTGGEFDLFVTKLATPASSGVTVDGRVLSPDGRPLRGALVSLTDTQGVTRTVTTSSLGYFSFTGVNTTGPYTIRVSSKRFRFAPRELTFTNNVTLEDLVGSE